VGLGRLRDGQTRGGDAGADFLARAEASIPKKTLANLGRRGGPTTWTRETLSKRFGTLEPNWADFGWLFSGGWCWFRAGLVLRANADPGWSGLKVRLARHRSISGGIDAGRRGRSLPVCSDSDDAWPAH